ncbi:alpha/beta hydrolase [Chryseobacterium tructae]|uniref:alpha/beta fold hydrolase n=1 Tax=Chryseobacterium tructae TaxID=1037380 RepID=UPI0025B395EB|nr:alpha/beta hydrolase [Chryseobacterium tructae]MDN3693105.1 alpha/beta hydrolase [Chryseobacterium tructae]
MRHSFISFIALLFSIIMFGQGQKPGDEYREAREIIKDLDSIVNPNGIQERYKVVIGGTKQWVYARGQNKENPVILFVHGGPASPIAPVMWMFQRPIEEYFTVVNYDQRASGKTYNANDTLSLKNTININQYVDDAITLAELIKEKYKKKKVLLIGHSWGTIISMKAALKRPDLFYAYVGIGQIINTRDNERLSVDFAVKEATRLKNDNALKELASIAPYPGNTPITRQRIIIARKWPQYYGGLTAYRNNSRYFFQAPLLSPEYSYDDAEAIGKGSLFTLSKCFLSFLVQISRMLKHFQFRSSCLWEGMIILLHQNLRHNGFRM